MITRILESPKVRSVLRGLGLSRLLNPTPIDGYRRGTVIYQEDDPSSACYLVLDGACESRRNSSGGKDETAVLGPGDVFGESDVLGEQGYHRTIRVTEDSVLLRIGRNRLRGLLHERPELSGYLNWKSRGPLPCPDSPFFPSPACRVILLASLSPQIPDIGIGEKLAGALHSETGASVLRVHFTKEETATPLDDRFPLDRCLQRNGSGFASLSVRVTGDGKEAGRIGSLLSQLSGRFSYLLLHAGADAPIEALVSCLDQCSTAYVLLRQTPEDLYGLNLLMRELRSLPHMDRSKIKPVVYFQGEEKAHGLCHWIEQSSGIPVHFFLRDSEAVPAEEGVPLKARGASFDANIRRLAREISGRRLGLALSSGGARGLAHIGVLQVLEENGIEVDVIAGSSMGAYVASIWGCGYDGKFLEKLALEIRNPWGLRHIVDLILLPRQGFLRGERAKRRLKQTIGDAHFSDLVRPIRIVATRLDTLERKVFTRGDVASAVHASIAIPGICVPVTVEEVTYVDGGIADPLPVDVLAEMGIDRIIAVNTIPTPEHIRECMDVEREMAGSGRGWPAVFSALNHHFNLFASGNMFDTMMRSLHGVQIRVAETSCLGADVVLRPHSCEGKWHDFGNAGRYIALGRRAAEENLAQIKALAEIPTHGPTNAPHKMAAAA